MIKLKARFIKAITNDPFQFIYSGYASRNDINESINNFYLLNYPKKKQIIKKIRVNLDKEKSKINTSEVISNLILVDFLSTNSQQCFGSYPKKLAEFCKQKSKVKGSTKQQKRIIGEHNLISFYLQFLKIKVWSQVPQKGHNFEEIGNYSQKAIQSIKLLLNHDFLFQYNLSHSSFPQLTKIVLENVLKRISQDLQFLVRYVEKWAPIILNEEGSQSILINQIYEQVVYISKNLNKFEYLNRILQGNIKFPKYTLDKCLNQEIEKTMLCRQQQKLMFISQRRLRTEPSEDYYLMNENHEEITESEIICNINI